jgi:CheY-like chemotaxis protein
MNETAPRRPRVLVVEDHDDMRELLTQVLEMSGYEVGGASSADAALLLAAQWAFDLALIDIGLPRKDGIQLMRELREQRAVVGVALSGYGMEAHVRACRDAGFAAHLLKPVEAETLLEVLRGLRAA